MATKEKTDTFGGCNFSHTSPTQDALSPDTVTLNIVVSFEEALKLNLAIDECVRRLNKYNRSTREGKRAAVNLTVHLRARRIFVTEGKSKAGAQEDG